MDVGIEARMLHVALGKRKECKCKGLQILVPLENSGSEDRGPVVAPEADTVLVDKDARHVMATGSSQALKCVGGELELIESSPRHPSPFPCGCTTAGNVGT